MPRSGRRGSSTPLRLPADRVHRVDEETRARHAAQHRRSLIRKSAAGDPDAGRAMLQHAMAAMRRAAPRGDVADAVALLWLADAIAQSFDGVPLDRAIGLERTRGRPALSAIRKVVDAVPIWHAVNDLAARLEAEGVQAPRRTAQERVAMRIGRSASAVRAACALIASKRSKGDPAE